ncbi:SRPBCC family protein [Leptospira idonii]|uniref:SRPBCC domain-containing protein n=1 Tax=Leptospira idonii TaxID=1193500 RepID=A0A4R9LWX1_9LEPT|nr:SRPBCC domain-containing protein [Leptospira idonii]TGN18142.1 SRPBCC domain-containing protein [Leptospira idonii]
MTALILKVEKKINADSTRLFRAWLKPDDFAKWFLAEDTIGFESVRIDPRPGGQFQINMLLNGQVLPHSGEYITIEEPNKLVFTWKSHMTDERDTLVTVLFQELPPTINKDNLPKPQTLITLTHERLTEDFQIKEHSRGWTNILEGLDQWLGKE